MTRKQRAYLHIITLPFVISAAVEFLRHPQIFKFINTKGLF